MVKLGDIYEQVNDLPWPRFQYFMILIISMTFFSHGGVPLLLPFLTSTKSWECLTEKCNQEIPLCAQLDDLVDSDWRSTVSAANDGFLKQYGIACGYEGYISSIISGLFAGFMVGIVIGGKLMDKFGRHRVTFTGVYMFCGAVLLHAASDTDFKVFGAAHVLCGFLSGITGAVFVYQTELTITRLRNIGVQVHTETFSMGMLYGAALTYYLEDFGAICFWLMVPALVFNTLIFFFIPESPFWLQVNGKDRKVVQALEYVAKFNGVKFSDKGDVIEKEVGDEPEQAGSAMQLFTYTRFTRKMMFTFILAWTNAAFCFWSLSLNVGDLIGNIFTNQILISMFDLLNRPINYYGVKVMRRVRFLRACNVGMMISAVLCMLPFPHEIIPGFNLQKISALGGRFLSDFYFNTIFLHTSEVLPTEVRAAGLGVCSSAGRIGSVVAPFVILLNSISPNIIFCIIFGLSAGCWVLYRDAPETHGKMLPHTLQDMDDLIRREEKVDRNSKV